MKKRRGVKVKKDMYKPEVCPKCPASRMDARFVRAKLGQTRRIWDKLSVIWDKLGTNFVPKQKSHRLGWLLERVFSELRQTRVQCFRGLLRSRQGRS
jgi:hypothetical protein